MAKTSVLVVEDESIVAKDIQQSLIKLGYNVVGTASTGEKALALANELRPDIILMDIHLGDDTIDGVSLMKKIRKTTKHNHIKIFAVTAYAEDTDSYINDGFDGVYVKPVIKEEIFEFINKNISNIYISK
jgi:CheY-like chemotaxis protein